VAAINKTTYLCEAVTPMFIYGAASLELRASSLKGSVRYWWRALNGYLPVKELQEKERLLFGSSNEKVGRSPVVLRIIPGEMQISSEYLLPHQNKAPLEAFSIGSQFQVIITSMGTFDEHAGYEAIIEAALLLGGLGRRSRRGFGSVAIIAKDSMSYAAPHDLQTIAALLNSVNEGKFCIKKGKIVSHGFAGDYPYLKSVELGKAYNNAHELLIQIGTATHNVSKGGSDYTGFSKDQRKLASPVYVTVLRIGSNYHPLITTLNTVFEPEYVPRGEDKQAALREAIL
jgi:CRISPR-associated protein Cmr1